jgi:hypothetical protein
VLDSYFEVYPAIYKRPCNVPLSIRFPVRHAPWVLRLKLFIERSLGSILM